MGSDQIAPSFYFPKKLRKAWPMNRKRTTTIRLTAMLVSLALAAAELVIDHAVARGRSGRRRTRHQGEGHRGRVHPPLEGIRGRDASATELDPWTDDGYRRMSNTSVSVEDDAREAEVRMDRTDATAAAYGFTVSMLVDGERIQSKAKYLFPYGPMDKRVPFALEAL